MSSKLPSCLIDWRPSRLQQAGLLALGLLAALALCLSALPWFVLVPSLPAVIGAGGLLAVRESQRSPCALRVSADGAVVAVVTAQGLRHLSDPAIQVRWPLAQVAGRTDQGGRFSLTWWPDTLDASGRRMLRLASRNPVSASGPGLATMSG